MKFKIGLAVLFGALTFASCDSETTENVEDRMDTIAENVEAKVDQVVDKDDNKEFVNDAVENNNKELYFLALGKQMGGADVKSSAKMMEADHKKMGDEVMAYAKAKGVAIEADTTDTDHDMATREKGADWDKDWADKMVDDHEKTIRLFEDAENDVDDPELKTLITKSLPTLRHHLEMAKKLQDKMKK